MSALLISVRRLSLSDLTSESTAATCIRLTSPIDLSHLCIDSLALRHPSCPNRLELQLLVDVALHLRLYILAFEHKR